MRPRPWLPSTVCVLVILLDISEKCTVQSELARLLRRNGPGALRSAQRALKKAAQRTGLQKEAIT